MAGLFEDILTNLQEKKQEGKISGGYRYKDGKLNIGGGYYGDDSMFEVDVNKDGGNILFKKRFADGGSTNGSGDKAFTAKVKELMDDGYEFGEAVKEAMRQGYNNGGLTERSFTENIIGEKLKGFQPELPGDQLKNFFKQKYNIKLRGDETLNEIKILKKLLENFDKEIPNLKGYASSDIKIAGKRGSLKTIAKDLDDFGPELVELAKEYDIDLINSHREQRKALKKQLSFKQSASSVDEAKVLFDKQEAVENTFNKLKEQKFGNRRISAVDRIKLKNEAVARIAGREKSEVIKKLKNFKNKDVVTIKEGNKVVDVIFKDAKKEAEFVEDLTKRFSYPKSSGGASGSRGASYAKDGGVLDQQALKKKYFKDYNVKTVDQITAAVADRKGLKQVTTEDFIFKTQRLLNKNTNKGPFLPTNAQAKKLMKDNGYRHYVEVVNNSDGTSSRILRDLGDVTKSKRLSIDKKLDPDRIKLAINEKFKKGSNIDTSHSIKQGLLNPDKPGIQLKAETLETLYPVRSDLNKGKMGNFDNSVLNLAENELKDIAKQRNSLIDSAGKIIKGKENELAKLNAKGTKIARNFSQADEMFGTVYKGAPGKASGPTNVKGVLNFEVFTPNADGTISTKLVGGNKAKSYAGVSDNIIAKTPLSKLNKAQALQFVEDAGVLKNAVSKLKGSQLGSVCRVLNKLAKGGRVGFASGGTMANCLKAIDNNPAAAVRAISSIGKSSGKLKSVVNIAKGVLKTTGYGLLAEVAFATPFAIADLRAGESGKRIIGNATMGLVGDTVTDEQKEFMGKKGYRAYELEKANNAYNALGISAEESFSPDDDMLISERLTQADNTLNKKMQPYIMEDGTFNETQFNQDYGIAQAGLKNIEDVKKMRRDKIQEGIRNRIDPYANDFMAADGGIAALPREVANPTNYGIFGTKVYNN